MLDCRTLDSKLLPVEPSVRLVICNSMVKHELAAGEYNQRRAQCETGVQALHRFYPQVRALRDVTLPMLERHADEMSELVFRRCRHVVAENNRVLSAADALKVGDLTQFGELMYASHASLRDDYEVSCNELDLLTELARECEGVYGARMTGGGFGGCTINLVQENAVERMRNNVITRYAHAAGINAAVYVCSPAGGAGEISMRHRRQ